MIDVTETMQAGLEHHRAGRLVQAERFYQAVLQAQPRHAGAAHLLGLLAFQAGKPDLAAQYVERAVSVDGFHAPYRADLAEIYRALNKIPEATSTYEEALRLNPEMPEVQNNLGTLYRAQGRLIEAIDCFHQAVEANPEFAEAHRNLGAALQKKGEIAEAQAVLERSVKLAPSDPQNYFRLGTVLHEQGRLLEAIACYQKSLTLEPNFPAAAYQCAVARMAHGDLPAGWLEFERFAVAQYAGPRIEAPWWNGQELAGQAIFIHARNTPGDTMQFLRYLPLMEQRGGRVVLDVEPRLRPLLERAGWKNLVTQEHRGETFKAQVHLLSLPRIFGTTLDSIPAPPSYLSADNQLRETWRERLKAQRGVRVGIVWQGDPAHPLAERRSVPLAEFAPLAALPGVTLISLQKHHGLEQLRELPTGMRVVEIGEFDESHGAFVDTAAVIANLDLVIAADTAVAHLAGALGVKVWVALPMACDWRWLRDRVDNPWYPAMRLFRQSQSRVWQNVFAEMAQALSAETAARPAG